MVCNQVLVLSLHAADISLLKCIKKYIIPKSQGRADSRKWLCPQLQVHGSKVVPRRSEQIIKAFPGLSLQTKNPRLLRKMSSHDTTQSWMLQIPFKGTQRINQGFPGGSDSKESACNAEDPGLIPGSGRSPGEENGNPLQYSWLENPMDRRAWQVTVRGVAKSWTRLSD